MSIPQCHPIHFHEESESESKSIGGKCPFSLLQKSSKNKCTSYVQLSKEKSNACKAETFANLLDLEKNLDQTGKKHSSISWEEFNGNTSVPTDASQLHSQKKHAGKIVKVKQSDFDHGTLRVRAPCTLQITENISFNANASDNWFPTSSQRSVGALYESDAYALGFFAAIAIETDHVLIDLQNHVMEQSQEHALQQRFFALFELADQPFIPAQGPANFGIQLDSAKQLVIRNGTLGRSSHHGIHGNGNRDVYIHNLDIGHYEVAGIALNGPINLLIQKVNLNGSRTDVPVAATYSAARFLTVFINEALQLTNFNVNPMVVISRNILMSAQAALQTDLQTAFNAVIHSIGSIPSVFALNNNEGLLDGNGYGLLFNPLGVAVNGFVENLIDCKTGTVHHISVDNVNIKHTAAAVDETVGLWNPTVKKMVVDTAGAKLAFNKIVNQSNGKYVGTSLSDAQIALARLVNDPNAGLNTNPLFKVMYIPPAVVSWVYNSLDIDGSLIGNGFTYSRNGDAMSHVNKGVFGIKADGVCDLSLKCVKVTSTKNAGAKGHFSLLRGEHGSCSICHDEIIAAYEGAKDGGHPAQGSIKGYGGANVRGISLSACQNVSAHNVSIDGVEAYFGSASGVDVFNHSTKVHLENVSIDNVYGANKAPKCDFTQGYYVPYAEGIHVASNVTCVGVKRSTIGDHIDAVGDCVSQISIDNGLNTSFSV